MLLLQYSKWFFIHGLTFHWFFHFLNIVYLHKRTLQCMWGHMVARVGLLVHLNSILLNLSIRRVLMVLVYVCSGTWNTNQDVQWNDLQCTVNRTSCALVFRLQISNSKICFNLDMSRCVIWLNPLELAIYSTNGCRFFFQSIKHTQFEHSAVWGLRSDE